MSEPDWREDDDWHEPEGGLHDECGRLTNGTCMFAGTEHCDFECPYRDR